MSSVIFEVIIMIEVFLCLVIGAQAVFIHILKNEVKELQHSLNTLYNYIFIRDGVGITEDQKENNRILNSVGDVLSSFCDNNDDFKSTVDWANVKVVLNRPESKIHVTGIPDQWKEELKSILNNFIPQDFEIEMDEVEQNN